MTTMIEGDSRTVALLNALRAEPLWPSEVRVLRWLDGEGRDTGLLCDSGECWTDDRVAWRVVYRLLRRAFISSDNIGQTEYYFINEDGREALARTDRAAEALRKARTGESDAR